MKKALKAMAAAAVLAAAPAAWATSSTTFWTPATTYVQPYLVPHITYDTYVAEKGGLPNDYGLTVGVLPFEKLQAEVGVDSFLPGIAQNNLYLNGKLAIPEGALGKDLPGVSAGVVQTGNNSFGAVGGGIGLYFTPAIDILTGPVFFNDSALVKSDFMWSVQLDVDFDLIKKKKT